MPNPLHWLIRRRRRLAVLVIGPLLLLNVAAFLHARGVTHYATGGTRTGAAQRLGRWEKAKVLATGIILPRPENTLTPAELDLPFTTHTIHEDGITLEAWHIPAEDSRGLVLLFHGHGGCKVRLLREAAALHELGYSAFLVDFRGSGGSSESVTTIGVFEADDVAAAVAYARQHWPSQPLALFGQSMGAAAILRAVARGASVNAILLECPFDRMLNAVQHRFETMGVPGFPFARLLMFWGGVQNGFNAFAHNPIDYAADGALSGPAHARGSGPARSHDRSRGDFRRAGRTQAVGAVHRCGPRFILFQVSRPMDGRGAQVPRRAFEVATKVNSCVPSMSSAPSGTGNRSHASKSRHSFMPLPTVRGPTIS